MISHDCGRIGSFRFLGILGSYIRISHCRSSFAPFICIETYIWLHDTAVCCLSDLKLRSSQNTSHSTLKPSLAQIQAEPNFGNWYATLPSQGAEVLDVPD